MGTDMGNRERVGVLLAQLGTPAAPTTAAVRGYLRQFLSDPRIVPMNRLLWACILHGLILPRRPRRSAALYAHIWSEQGSPLLVHTRRQAELLADALGGRHDLRVAIGMRYGEPSLAAGFDALLQSGCGRILVMPLFPQYSGATTGSCCDAIFAHAAGQRWVPAVRIAAPYFSHPAYIDALAGTINDAFASGGTPDRLMISYHGLPQDSVDQGDPYYAMCTATTAALAPRLAVEPAKVVQVFQSRFGRKDWLEPSAEHMAARLASEGIESMAVVCPGFAADCLETLHEIAVELRGTFTERGGQRFTYIPCLNDDPRWIRALGLIVREELGTWLG